MILETLADGVSAALEKQSNRIAQKFRAFGDWLREVSSPPSGVELRVLDGSQYTGVVLVQRNVVIAVLAFRQGFEPRGSTNGVPHPPSSPSPSPWSRQPRPLDPRWRREEDEPLWRTDDTVYR